MAATRDQASNPTEKMTEISDHASNMPWRVLGQSLGFPNHDQELWWLHTAPYFSRLLIQYGYETHSQYQHLSFYHRHILPVLGPFIRPGTTPSYPSVLGPEGYPFELSVNFQKGRGVVRLACEPIGEFAGTEHDPLNQFKGGELVGKLAHLNPNVDVRWFNYFSSQLSLTREEANTATRHLIPCLQHTNVVAVDLQDGEIVPKGYFFLMPKSVVTGISTSALALNAMERLDAGFEPSLSVLRQFLSPYFDTNVSGSANPQAFSLAFDCVEPRKSRLKLYVVSRDICMENIRALWTAGGRLNDPTTLRGLTIAEKLWSLLGFKDTVYSRMTMEQLPLQVNYGMKSGSSAIKPQLYLPLQDTTDELVADALTEFFKYLEWEGLASSYKDDLVSNL
jgi:DMATS type aromatic prenyltransferase